MEKLNEIARIKVERFYDVRKKEEEVMAAVRAIDEVDKVLNVLEEKVAPYSYYIPMAEVVKPAREWRSYTSSSRDVIIAELNGCIDIVNCRIRLFNEKDVLVVLLEGKNKGQTKTYKESTAQAFVECGMARYA